MTKRHPQITTSAGINLVNFSSPHEFNLNDGSVLPACTPALCKELSLGREDVETPNDGGWVDVNVRFVMSESVRHAIDALNDCDSVDVVLAPFPIISAIKEEGRPLGKFRTVVMADRVTKKAHHDKFGC